MSEKWMHRVSFFKSALDSFMSSSHPFRLIHSIFPTAKPFQLTRALPLYILDSSFNPPTAAHLNLLLAALASRPSTAPQRILLLLATQNADKPPRPASFEHRLCMMERLAIDLHANLHDAGYISIDLGVTKLPYFVDKAKAIEACDEYAGIEQVHLVGFDTLTRICDASYYPPSHTLKILSPFLEKHRLRVTSRVGKNAVAENGQEDYMRAIAEGALDSVGGRREWVTENRIQLVHGSQGTVSSTRVREAVKHKDWAALQSLTTPGVQEWILTTSAAMSYLEHPENGQVP
ncbi:hypothetical protein K3495_g3170 [Podosphaera aphanis]|nr:hypothetical protein K3495_g3170 [Podosphaera aphanis]